MTPTRTLRPHHLAACLALALAAPLAPAATVTNCDDGGTGSLRDAIANAGSGDTIDFAGLGCSAIVLSGGALSVTVANLTVQGPGSASLSLSGNDASRVFDHSGGGTLDLRGLTLTHGRASGDGGCVRAATNLSLDDVIANACVAGDATIAGINGGAIAVIGNATINGGSFDGNRVDGTARVRGGAIAVGNLLSVTGTSFTNNIAWSHQDGNPNDDVAEGGAIFALGDTHLTDSTITGNTVKSDSYEVFGGGVAVGSHPDHAIASLDVLRGHVHDNTTTTQCGVCAPQGGGIAAVGETRLRDSTILSNTVYSPGHYGGGGGVRVFQAASFEVIGSTIAGNHAPSAGGGLFGPESGVLSVDTTLVTGNSSGNEAGLDEGGGGILCLGCAVVLQSSTVSGNTAGADGGGIFIHYGEYAPQATQIINSTISGNTSAKEGGGIMWVSFYTCDDFTVYRFTANGDLDTSLLGNGVLHIPFNLGDDNKDIAARIALTTDGDLIVAGLVAALPARRLGVARYTTEGQPKAGFGVDGKVDLVADQLINTIGGLHVMRDGRIVITGRYAPNLLSATQTVIRLQPGGAVDAGFGNFAPGVSHADVGNLLGDAFKRLLSEGSLLETDGSVLQVGAGPFGGAHSNYDFAVLKWRPDGTLDTSVGPAGLRSYSLDFAGPNPADDDDNFDRAYGIVRQGDGKYVILGQSYSSDGRGGISLVRLTRTLDLDPGFGDGGKLRYLSQVAIGGADCTLPVNPLLQGGRIVAGVNACIGNGLFTQAAVGLQNDLLFADGLD